MTQQAPRVPPLADELPEPEWGLSPIVQQLRAAASSNTSDLEAFWARVGAATPLIETAGDGRHLVTFLWEDSSASDVLIEINKVTHTLAHNRMQRVPQTDIWFRTLHLPSDWRGSYSFVPLDEGEYDALETADRRQAKRAVRDRGLPDPRNLDRMGTHGGNTVSVASLPAAPQQLWIHDPARPTPCGELVEHAPPGGHRVWSYQPAQLVDSDPEPDSAPLLIVLDGALWLESKHVVATVENLGAEIRPPVVLFVDTGDPRQRARHLAVDGAFDAYVVDELLPWARAQFRVSVRSSDVVVVGQSLGGLTAFKTVLEHSHAVGGAIAQSSSLWQDDMAERVAGADLTQVRLWLEVGSNEPVLLAKHRQLRAQVQARGIPFCGYTEFTGGHDTACWRGGIGNGLLALLGRS